LRCHNVPYLIVFSVDLYCNDRNWDHNDNGDTMKKCVTLSIGTTTITKKPDYDIDTSYLGDYGDTVKPGCVVIAYRKTIEELTDDEEIPERGREYRFFYPPDTGEKIGTPDYKKYALQDLEVMEDLNNSQWGFCGIVVKTKIITQIPTKNNPEKYTEIEDEIVSSLWGIEDYWNEESAMYITEIIEELKTDQKDQLLKIGFSDKDIEESFKNAKEVDL